MASEQICFDCPKAPKRAAIILVEPAVGASPMDFDVLCESLCTLMKCLELSAENSVFVEIFVSEQNKVSARTAQKQEFMAQK